MIDNFEQISKLLEFKDPLDFVQLYVFKRKKDQIDKENHQSVRTIKSYSISSIEELFKKKEEIIQLCEMFKARAYIHLTCNNHAQIGLLMIEEIAKRLQEKNYKQNYLFDSIVGRLRTKKKLWIIDIDNELSSNIHAYIAEIRQITLLCRPAHVNKIIAKIPTKNGYHLITTPFDLADFKKRCTICPDIQKNNPTLLYHPDSLIQPNL